MKEKIDSLVEELNKASYAYYMGNSEIMSNYEYDKKYDELLKLESETGYIRDDSPTQKVGYEVKSELKKEIHEFKALSLDKTKDRESLKKWLNDKLGHLGWKMDGLTVQLTYDDGKLLKAVTRGNGEIGENITHNAKYFKGVPKEIPFKGHVVVRGEAYISYKQFEIINDILPDDEKYKNPRNLASGSVRQLDAKESARRHVEFKAFQLVYAENSPFLISNEKAELQDTYATRYKWMEEQGFDIVKSFIVDKNTILDTISNMEKQVSKNDFPSDGLVLSYNDVKYGESLGMTGKFPKWSIAFKWADDTEETTITEIKWQPSRTGLINPVAVFEPVELEGTTVSRATAINVSTVEKLKLGVGSRISVYKANKIIPAIAENLMPSGSVNIPKACPICGAETEIKSNLNNGQIVKTLYCTNPDCQAKHVKKFVHFADRNCMNILGLSEATTEKFIEEGYIKEFKDIYHLSDYHNEIIELDGYGEKLYQKLMKSINNSRNVKLENFIAALGIPGIGKDAGKKIAKFLNHDFNKFQNKLESGDFCDVPDIGKIGNQAISDWYKNQKNKNETGESEYFNLLKEITFNKTETGTEPDTEKSEKNILENKTFVITGDLVLHKNRNELVSKIEGLGGKVTGSVSKKTDYLINNDTKSTSSKNKKAKELSIPIISEEEFSKMIIEKET